MPIYAVRNRFTGTLRLVDADRPATALRHVTQSEYDAVLATVEDGIDFARRNDHGAIETAGETVEARDAVAEVAMLAAFDATQPDAHVGGEADQEGEGGDDGDPD